MRLLPTRVPALELTEHGFFILSTGAVWNLYELPVASVAPALSEEWEEAAWAYASALASLKAYEYHLFVFPSDTCTTAAVPDHRVVLAIRITEPRPFERRPRKAQTHRRRLHNLKNPRRLEDLREAHNFNETALKATFPEARALDESEKRQWLMGNVILSKLSGPGRFGRNSLVRTPS